MTEFRIAAGFMPLMDSLILIIAREKGFAAAEGVDLTLVREVSWANIRDRIAVGHFDVAHMLGPMPVASSLGLSPFPELVIAPFALGMGGNALTVSTDLWHRMGGAGIPDLLDPAGVGAALAKIVRSASPRLRFAVVHQYSAQNYELRYWLAACGIRPVVDIDIVVVPPPMMTEALKAGEIDGHCVGEPWGSASVEAGAGQIITIKSRIWPNGADKVIGVTERWAGENPMSLAALLRALAAAAAWCGDRANLAEAAEILAAPFYLNLPQEIVERGLSGRLEVARGSPVRIDDFFTPSGAAANVPWQSHGLWYYSQMVRWGVVAHAAENAIRVASSYRPDLYHAALGGSADDGAQPRHRFFDDYEFDPRQLEAYLQAQI